jgi:hypothetical protein
MKASAVAVLLALSLVATPVEATEGRIRLENSGRDGRVEIVMSDEHVRTVEISIPGVVSAEVITVEAPAPLVRLSGGSIEGDQLLEAMVQQKVRESRRRHETVTVLPASPTRRVESRRDLNDVFTNVGYAFGPVWSVPIGPTGMRPKSSSCRERRPRSGATTGRVAPPPSIRSTHSMRAMMPRH